MTARAASSSAVRVRSRLSPLGLRRAELLASVDIIYKIDDLFNMSTIESSHAIERTLQRYVDDGLLAGAATLVWRDGRVRQQASVGLRDLESALPIERDTIFRIASLTKPVTTVA